jgi:hypothetical protein
VERAAIAGAERCSGGSAAEAELTAAQRALEAGHVALAAAAAEADLVAARRRRVALAAAVGGGERGAMLSATG